MQPVPMKVYLEWVIFSTYGQLKYRLKRLRLKKILHLKKLIVQMATTMLVQSCVL